MRLKDPTAWMEDLTVFLDDEEIAETAALFEPDVLYQGSKAAAAAWLSLVGIAAGALAAVTLSPGIRESAAAFAAYLAVAVVFIRGLRPLTERLLGRAMVWYAKGTVFWVSLLACVAVLGAGFDGPWLAYGLSTGGGLLIGLVHGSTNPNIIKREDAWLLTSLVAGPAGTVAATFVLRGALGEAGSIGTAMVVGSLAGGLFAVPMSVLLVGLWDKAHGLARMAMLFLHNDNFAAKAVSCLDNAIALAPDDPELYNLRGTAWSKMDRPERAAADWKRASELRPHDAEPLVNLAVDHLRRGELDRAVEALDGPGRTSGHSTTSHNTRCRSVACSSG